MLFWGLTLVFFLVSWVIELAGLSAVQAAANKSATPAGSGGTTITTVQNLWSGISWWSLWLQLYLALAICGTALL